MFDLITGSMQRPLRERAPGSKVISIVLHVVVLTAIIGAALYEGARELPEVPTMLAFVAPMPEAAPPPPPPPPPAAAKSQPAAPKPTPAPPSANAFVAPTEAPATIKPESTIAAAGGGVEGGVEGGVVGGVVGGIVGGISGGVVGGILPPPPPPPPAPRGPVRIGGQLQAPALVKRVEPTYPDLAAAAKITGIVILEAEVGTDGCVTAVRVLRPVHKLLDAAAIDALKQWQYSPLVLNGIPTPFVLTVTFTFSTR